MPATYAAVTASLNALREISPGLRAAKPARRRRRAGNGELGRGGGVFVAASVLRWWTPTAPCARWRSISPRGSSRLRDIDYRRGEARATLAEAEPADLVVASYMIGEIGDAERGALLELMWTKTRDTLLIVEPGTPAGYGRIIALREQLIASGAHVAAPCPHDGQCPLHAPDWCHFTQRLPRSRAHKQVKEAELPFEDEKFSYVALTREPVAPRPTRVLAQPVVSKVEVTAKLCTSDGLVIAKSAPPR